MIDYLKTRLLEFGQISFKKVMITYSELCASLNENLMSEFYVN